MESKFAPASPHPKTFDAMGRGGGGSTAPVNVEPIDSWATVTSYPGNIDIFAHIKKSTSECFNFNIICEYGEIGILTQFIFLGKNGKNTFWLKFVMQIKSLNQRKVISSDRKFNSLPFDNSHIVK